MDSATNKYLKTKTYDLVIIGSGPAGHKAALQCAAEGKKVAVVDRRRTKKVGGVSLHTGTIPSKTLREAVLYLTGLRHRHIYGENYHVADRVTLSDLLQRVDAIIGHELAVLESQFKAYDVDVHYGEASFIDSQTLEVNSEDDSVHCLLHTEKTIIATGTIPRRPENIEFDHEVIFDSNFLFSSKCHLEALPKSLIVIGAGVIGVEYAAMFAILGCDVTLIDKNQHILSYLDNEINSFLVQELINNGVHLSTGSNYASIKKTAKGTAEVVLENNKVFTADAALFTMGRTPCVSCLNLEKTTVTLGKRDVIVVDDNFQTHDPFIYACGDVIGFPALASTSAEQGRVAARNAMGLSVENFHPTLLPFAIYSIPELSTIGKTEEELNQEKIPYEIGIAYYFQVAKATIKAGYSGMLKILFHRENWKILGVHVIGDQAAELIHIGQTVMTFGGTVEYFVNNVFNYPTWAEAYKVAAQNGIQKLTCKVKYVPETRIE